MNPAIAKIVVVLLKYLLRINHWVLIYALIYLEILLVLSLRRDIEKLKKKRKKKS